LLVADAVLLLRDDLAGEGVHEVLGAGLTRLELAETISLLLVKHLSIFNLSHDVGADLSLTIIVRLSFVGLVLSEHLLEILLLLTALLLLQRTLHLHFILKAIDEVNFSLEDLLIFPSLALLLVVELAVTALLLLHDLLAMLSHFLLFTLTEEHDVLRLECFIGTAFFELASSTLLLLLELLIKLTAN